MKTQADDASQAKIKVRLEILPEKQSFENRTLATEIANDIFEHLDQAPSYSIEPYEPRGAREMSGATEFLIQIAPHVVFLGGIFVGTLRAKMVEKAAEKVINLIAETLEKVADLIAEILKKVEKGRYSKLDTDVKIQSLPGRDDINAQGPLTNALDEARADLMNMAKHLLEETTSGLHLPEMTEEIEVTVSMKVSRRHL